MFCFYCGEVVILSYFLEYRKLYTNYSYRKCVWRYIVFRVVFCGGGLVFILVYLCICYLRRRGSGGLG